MLWQGRCVDALPCNYNEIRVQRVAAWQVVQLQCCSCNWHSQQQLQWQLAQFQLLQRGASFVLFCFVLFCSSPSFFLLPPAACSAVLSFVCCCCPLCPLCCYLSPAPCATTTSYNYYSFVLPWPKLAMRATALLLSAAWQIF